GGTQGARGLKRPGEERRSCGPEILRGEGQRQTVLVADESDAHHVCSAARTSMWFTATRRSRVTMYRTASAMSSDCSLTIPAVRPSRSALADGGRCASISVSTVPGPTTPTRTRCPMSSWRSPSPNALTPNLVSEYTAVPGRATQPAVELTVTTS